MTLSAEVGYTLYNRFQEYNGSKLYKDLSPADGWCYSLSLGARF